MTSTSIRTGRGASQTLPGGTRDAGTQAMQAAGRELLAAVGNQVLKVAVDRAVLKVDQVAARLDTIAAGGGTTPRSAPSRKPPGRPADSGEQRPEHPRHRVAAAAGHRRGGGGRTPRSAPSRKPPARPTDSGEQRPEHPTRVKMGAAVSFVMRQAMHLLQLIQRLAQQLLAVLTRLLRRLQKLLGALVHRGVAAARQTVDRLREKLKGATSRGGVVMGAAGGLVKALGAGTNPVWGAVKGAIGGLSTEDEGVDRSRACPRRAAWARRARRGAAGAARIRRRGRGAHQRANMMPAPAGLTQHNVRHQAQHQAAPGLRLAWDGSTDPGADARLASSGMSSMGKAAPRTGSQHLPHRAEPHFLALKMLRASARRGVGNRGRGRARLFPGRVLSGRRDVRTGRDEWVTRRQPGRRGPVELTAEIVEFLRAAPPPGRAPG